MHRAPREVDDIRWSKYGEERMGEFGVVGGEQADESHYDDRDVFLEEDGRINFAKNKLYGRDMELQQLQSVYDRLSTVDVDLEVEEQPLSQIVFLSGYSGSGKSALVHEFVKKLKEKNLPYALAEGKYAELRCADPFSAICSAIGKYCQSLSEEEGKEVFSIWEEVQESVGDDAAQLLLDLIPDLARLNIVQKEASSRPSGAESFEGRNMKASKAKLMNVFQLFLRFLCTQKRRIIMFIDDLQWADDGSLELFASLLKDKDLKQIMFIMTYRSNEVRDGHPLAAFSSDLKQKREVEVMQLSELSRIDVEEFIGDTLGLEYDAVLDLSEAIFNKTLGNILFTMQAIEQLVRKNAIYYDNMIFCWQWSLSKTQLENELTGNILDMVQAKLLSMPIMMQDLLVVASYIRTNFDVSILMYMLKEDGNNKEITEGRIIQTLKKAVFDGLLQDNTKEGGFSFAHDRIQEAARSLVAEEDRNQMLLKVGNSLRECYNISEFAEDWMLFTAATHLNTVPHNYYDKEAIMMLVKLNIQATKLSISVASFHQASIFLRAGVAYLNKDIRWESDNYSLTIEVLLLSLQVEFGLGNCDLVEEYCEEILEHATCLSDKGPAYVYILMITSDRKDQNRDFAIKKGIEFLEYFNIIVPDPDNVQQSDIDQEEKRCELALQGRQTIDLLDSPPIADSTTLSLFNRLAIVSAKAGKFHFLYLLSLISIRICAKDGMSEFLPSILMSSNFYQLYVKDDAKLAYDLAVTSKIMVDRMLPYLNDDIYSFVTAINNMIALHYQTVHSILLSNEEIYQHRIQRGDDEGFVVAMFHGWCNIYAGIPLTFLTDTKFAWVEDQCQDLNQPPSMFVFFWIFRQFSLNMRGESKNPTVFDGKAMTEKNMLNYFNEETNPYKQTLRDLSICKLMIACISGCLTSIEKMVDILKSWPDIDMLVPRQFNRFLWVGMGAFTLARQRTGDKKGKEEYLQIGNKYLKIMRNTAQKGNPNAKVAFLCLQAESCQSGKHYDLAINTCRELGFMHLNAIMNEHSGLYKSQKKSNYMSKKKNIETSELYLKRSVRIYAEYGAFFKVKQMESEYSFLDKISSKHL